MKKVIFAELALILLLAGVMALLLYQKDPRTDVTEKEVHTMFATVKGDAPVNGAGALQIRRIFGLNAADHDLIVYYAPIDSMDVCEFILIRTDEGNLPSVKKALEDRLASQLEAFTNYGQDQTNLLNKAIIWENGNYLCLIVSEEPHSWLDAVKALLEV
jgi:hypothetical protein